MELHLGEIDQYAIACLLRFEIIHKTRRLNDKNKDR